MDFLACSCRTVRDFARHTVLICAVFAAGAFVSGCKSAGPADEAQSLFTMEEMVSANRKAAVNAWAAGKRAAETDIAAERALVQARIDKAVERGRAEGDTAAISRIAAEQATAEKEAAERAATRAAATRKALAEIPLFGSRKLRSDKGRALEAGQILDMINAQLDTIGYKLVVAAPYKTTKTLPNYDDQKVLLAMSPEFNEAFIDHVQRMSLMDGLDLLNKLYGFSAWCAHDEKIIWLGFLASPPVPLPNAKLDLYFNEKDFIERAR